MTYIVAEWFKRMFGFTDFTHVPGHEPKSAHALVLTPMIDGFSDSIEDELQVPVS